MNLIKSICNIFKRKRKTKYMHIVKLNHKDGVVKITIESQSAELTAHVSNSIKRHYNGVQMPKATADKMFKKADEAFKKADEAFDEMDTAFKYMDGEYKDKNTYGRE